ncbi:hypothetical protein EXW51_29205 (plasmid) [Bacillus mycoides]|uniref:hypothetical protein n=1 Tax=Bacillus mycoides TaxID=1405 RepID=UPI001C00CB8E|nr:hypothetical protein [Bacillus mycoides]QWH31952.1 hypothetical protein EXW51_29205 [Bacillus mycoides]
MNSLEQQILTSNAPGEIKGLPQSLPVGALVTLFKGGTSLAMANGELLTTYTLTQSPTLSSTKELSSFSLPGYVCAISESSLGLIIATHRKEGSTLSLLTQGNSLTTILELPGRIKAFASAGVLAYATVQLDKSQIGYLIEIDLRQREVLSERKIENVKVQLSLDQSVK